MAIAVQAGFIAGSVGAALANLPDRIAPRTLIRGAAILAALANAALLLAHGVAMAIPSRFLVGVAVAGVYAPGIRLVATHYRHGRGVATGVVVGALTRGSATPHLVRGLGGVAWQATIVATSVFALLAAVVIRPVRPGADAPATPPLDIGAAVRALRGRPVRLTTLGYLGHMWELYAFWAWLPAFFIAPATPHSAPTPRASRPPRSCSARSGSPVSWAASRPGGSPTASGARERRAPRCWSAQAVAWRAQPRSARPRSLSVRSSVSGVPP